MSRSTHSSDVPVDLADHDAAWHEGAKVCSDLIRDVVARLRDSPEWRLEVELEALWEAYCDKDNMFWRSRYCLPITREELEAMEDAWLNSGESDEYDSCSYFIDKYYTDEEKQALWSEGGDKKRFHWRPGMRGPESIE